MTGKGGKKQKENLTFEVDHLQAFQEAGLEWPPTLHGGFLEKTKGVSDRAKQLVYYMEKVHGVPAAGEAEVTFDCNMTIGWATPTVGKTPCLASTSRIWCLRTGCELRGEDCLHLQGFDRSVLQQPNPRLRGPWTREKLVDLAGDSFACHGQRRKR